MAPHSLKPLILRNKKSVKSLELLCKERNDLLLVFLFGSCAGEHMRPSSDVDIGILFKTFPDRDAIVELTADLSSILKREVDLVVLNQASPVLKMQILKTGILLYASDRKYFHQFFVATANEYDDLKRIRRVCEQSILKGRIYAR
jgi:uncharacterized protein